MFARSVKPTSFYPKDAKPYSRGVWGSGVYVPNWIQRCSAPRSSSYFTLLRRQSIKKYFTNNSRQSIVTNNFWKVMKPFLINNDHINSGNIMLTYGRSIITNDKQLMKVCNSFMREVHII